MNIFQKLYILACRRGNLNNTCCMFREQVEDLQKEIQKIEADYRRQVGITTPPVLKKSCITKYVLFFL